MADPVNFNIIGKDTLQSSNFRNDKLLSGAAVDGCKDPVMLNGCCTHTDGSLEPAWWTVDLGQTVILNSVTVFNRNSHRKYFYHLVCFVRVSITDMETRP